MKHHFFAAISLVLSAFAPSLRAAETVLIPYTHSWQYMHPMGRNPTLDDPNFDTTWWRAVQDFAAEYNGPEFGGSNVGDANSPASINTGSGPGPFGYADVDNWNGANNPLLAPLEGGPPVTSMGTFLTRPTNGNRKASYYRTTFDLTQMLLKPVIRCMVDDGAVIFLDGVQVARLNLTLPTPQSVPSYATLSGADPAAPNQTENTLYTIDLTRAGLQASSGTLQAEVINTVTTLNTGIHTLAVFAANVGPSNADMLMALQLTADNGGINPVFANVTRSTSGTPANPADDTFSFDVTVTKSTSTPGSWHSNQAQQPAGAYGTSYHFTGFPVSGPAEILFTDASDPGITAALTVEPPPPPLWIGEINLPGQTGPLLCTAGTAAEWIQSGAATAGMNNAVGTPHLLESITVPIPDGGAVFSAILEVEDNSALSNFEASDSVEAMLILENSLSGEFAVTVIPASLDRNGDHSLTGFGGVNYNSSIASDELNPGGLPAEASYVEGISLTAVIPPGTLSARFVVSAVNNHVSETFRIKQARFLPAGSVPDLDRDGISDADELAAGTDPLSPSSLLVSTQTRNGSNIAVSFPSVPNRTYRILSSSNMLNWVAENTAVITGDGSVLTLNVPSTVPRKFFCVQCGRGINPWP